MTPEQRAKEAAAIVRSIVARNEQERLQGDIITAKQEQDEIENRILSAIDAATAEQDAEIKSLLAVIEPFDTIASFIPEDVPGDNLLELIGGDIRINIQVSHFRAAAKIHKEVTGGE